MKKSIIALLFSLAIISLNAQEINKEVKDPETKDMIIVGKCNVKGLKKSESYRDHYYGEKLNYVTDNTVIEKLENKVGDITIRIVLGTWCHDSKLQVPRFFKILDELEYDTDKVDMICIDREKEASGIDISPLDIERVPTFIFYRNGPEIGRIIENPDNTLEKDMLDIIRSE